MKKIIISLILGIFFIGCISALTVDFFYSPQCPHCQKVMPTVIQLGKKYPNHEWNTYDVSQGSYNVGGVPLVELDNGVSLRGSLEIPKYLECEVQEMTTKECETYSADEGIDPETKSWFKRE